MNFDENFNKDSIFIYIEFIFENTQIQI